MKNKLLLAVAFITLIFSFLFGCSKSYKIDELESKVEELQAPVESINDAIFPLVFENVFLQFCEKINILDFDEILTLINGDFIIESTVPTEEDMGSIKVKDESDMYIYMAFGPNDKNQETLCLITYGNGNYEISVSDAFHTSNIKYNTYAVDREPKSIEVTTLEELKQFIFVEVMERTQAYQKSVESLQKLTVELTAKPIIDSNGKVAFEITTNLPDNVQLMLTLSGEDYLGQGKITIKNGTATSEQFSSNGNALKGAFKLSVSMPLPKLQDDTVTAIIGINGEFLVGDLVEKSTFEDSNIVEAEFEYEF